MNFTKEQLEHMSFLLRVDLNGNASFIEDYKRIVKQAKKNKEAARHIEEYEGTLAWAKEQKKMRTACFDYFQDALAKLEN